MPDTARSACSITSILRSVRGEAIALLGHNGAGKTTLLQTVFGLQPIWKGRLLFAGRPLGERHSARAAVALGIAMIPAERFVFPDLTVLENLRLGVRGLSAAEGAQRIHAAYEDLPILRERAGQLAGTMSGGEQRMVSLSMALMRKPALLLLDEPSLGLSPAIAEQMMARVRRLVTQGVSVVLVEQNVPAALECRVANLCAPLRAHHPCRRCAGIRRARTRKLVGAVLGLRIFHVIPKRNV